MKILDEITTIAPYTGPLGGVILDIGSPDIMKFPVAYMAEAGYWTQTDEEAANLRAYLQKGGFLVFDDFRGGDWDNFEGSDETRAAGRANGGTRHQPPDLSTRSSTWRPSTSCSSTDGARSPTSSARTRTTTLRSGCSSSRNYNNDVGEYWEFSDTGWTPIDLSNEAYKLGVNYIVYALTH